MARYKEKGRFEGKVYERNSNGGWGWIVAIIVFIIIIANCSS